MQRGFEAYKNSMDAKMNDSQAIQRGQYVFPYHQIPHIDLRGDGQRVRLLPWGFEYLIYMRRIADIIAAEEPASVLDVGCGDGFLLNSLPDAIDRLGVDIDAHALTFAQAFGSAKFRETDVADVTETFDVVCAVEVLEHVPDDGVAQFLRSCAARLRAGGLFVLSVPSDNVPESKKHFRHYNTRLLEDHLAAAGMTVESIDYFYAPTLAERIYRRATNSALVRGEIPFLQPLVWRHAVRNADRATARNGEHIIALLRQGSDI